MNEFYKKQAELLIKTVPVIAREEDLALQGGSAINLFIMDMPRLSVDIDLTYLPLESREISLKKIKDNLERIKDNLLKIFSGIYITGPDEFADEYKLICTQKETQVKIEVNTIIRGSLEMPVNKTLCQAAQNEFNLYAEIKTIPEGQLYGGKICAALDRQHPRDLFDIKHLFESKGIDAGIKRGFLFCLLSSKRPMHELIAPSFINQKSVLENTFAGMTREVFTYSDYENTRLDLIKRVHCLLDENDKSFLIGFKEGNPDWTIGSFHELAEFPSVQWKLQNIRKLIRDNPQKHQIQLIALQHVLNRGLL